MYSIDASVTEKFLTFYLNAVPGTSVVAFTAIRKGSIENFFYPASVDPHAIVLRVSDLVRKGYNLYVRCSVLKKEPTKGRGLKVDTLGTSFLYADIDTKDGVLEKLAQFKKPTILVDSGHGYHVWYRIGLFETDIKKAEEKNAWIASSLGGDKCFDAARVLRVPGTLNLKDPSNPLPVSMVEFNPHLIYPIDAFESSKISSSADAEFDVISAEPLPEDFLERIKKHSKPLYNRIISEGTAIRSGAPALPSGHIDHSRNDMWVSVKLLAMGYSKGAVLSVLTHPTWVTGEKYRQKANITYAIRTVVGAAKFLEEEGSKKPGTTRFFNVSSSGSLRFIPKKLGDYLQKRHPTITIGGQFYIYSNGVYKRDSLGLLRQEIVSLLKDEWTSHRENEVVSYIRSSTLLSPDDVQAKYINLLNGLLNPQTGQLYPHSPDYKSIIQIPVTYDPREDSSPAVDFVSSIVPKDVVDTVFEFLAFTLMSGYRYKKILFLVGESNTGKSTLLNWIRGFLGPWNVSTVALRALASDKFASASLYGKLANIYADLDSLPLSSVAQIKSLTGGDPVEAQYKFEKPFSFVNTAKLVFSANEFPSISGGDAAFYKRFLVIPCSNTFEFGKSADPFILEKYSTSSVLSGALNRVLEAYHVLLKRGGFREDMYTLQKGMDMLGENTNSVVAFIKEDTTEDPKAIYTKQQLYTLYKQWCYATGHSPLSMTKFGRFLKSFSKRLNITYKYMHAEQRQKWSVVGRRVLSEPRETEDGRVTALF